MLQLRFPLGRGEAPRRCLARMAAEIVQATRREKSSAVSVAVHLLVLHEQGARSNGKSFVEGLPRSSLRDFKGKLTFAPAGHDYHEWQEPRVLGRTLYFYFDPACMPLPADASPAHTLFAPRLFLEDATVRETALKLATSIETAGRDNRLYLEALGAVLGAPARPPQSGRCSQDRWCAVGSPLGSSERSQPISRSIWRSGPARQARRARPLEPVLLLSGFQAITWPSPHRYHTSRRIERAKTLLAQSCPSVTEIGLTVSFERNQLFTAAIRKATGLTPTAYRRSPPSRDRREDDKKSAC